MRTLFFVLVCLFIGSMPVCAAPLASGTCGGVQFAIHPFLDGRDPTVYLLFIGDRRIKATIVGDSILFDINLLTKIRKTDENYFYSELQPMDKNGKSDFGKEIPIDIKSCAAIHYNMLMKEFLGE